MRSREKQLKSTRSQIMPAVLITNKSENDKKLHFDGNLQLVMNESISPFRHDSKNVRQTSLQDYTISNFSNGDTSPTNLKDNFFIKS